MRLTEKQADIIAERLIQRVNDANTYFLTEIGGYLDKIKSLTPTKAHQLIQILKYGGNYEKIVLEIERLTNLNAKEINRIFKEYAKQDYKFYKQFYKYRQIPFTPFENNMALVNQTNALANIVRTEMYDFTRKNVLGYSVKDLDGNIVFKGLRDVYNQILDEAFLKIGQGKETFDMGMRNTLRQLGGSGLRYVDYESGRSVRLDSVVRTSIKARLRELHNENQKIIGSQIDADGVEISVHLNPAPDHQEVQGHQFYNEQFEQLQSTGVAKDVNGKQYDMHLTAKDGVPYESFRPISELNCYHYYFSIVVGVSEPEYNDKKLMQIIQNNNKGFELDGKHYTNYEGTQLQRKIETAIRKQKDIKTLAQASGDNTLVAEANKNISQLRAKYKQITQASGLLPKPKRTIV